MTEVFISGDVETDGRIPGEYSMLSMGLAAFTREAGLTPVSTFKVNLKPLPGAKQDSATMQWWETQPAAWKASTDDAVDAHTGMEEALAWVNTLQGKKALVVYPVWDFMFIHWYFKKFTGEEPFGFSALDLKSMLYGIQQRGGSTKMFKNTVKKNMPRHWFDGTVKHTHDALDDAIGQGQMLMNILKDMERRRQQEELDAAFATYHGIG